MLPVKEHSDEGAISINSSNSHRDISNPSADHFQGHVPAPNTPPTPCLPGSEYSNGQGPAAALTDVSGLLNRRAQAPQGQKVPVSAFAARAEMPDASLSARQMQMSMGSGQPAGAVPTISAL